MRKHQRQGFSQNITQFCPILSPLLLSLSLNSIPLSPLSFFHLQFHPHLFFHLLISNLALHIKLSSPSLSPSLSPSFPLFLPPSLPPSFPLFLPPSLRGFANGILISRFSPLIRSLVTLHCAAFSPIVSAATSSFFTPPQSLQPSGTPPAPPEQPTLGRFLAQSSIPGLRGLHPAVALQECNHGDPSAVNRTPYLFWVLKGE